MAKLVDALPSGGSVRKDVQVRILFWARKAVSLVRRLFLWLGENFVAAGFCTKFVVKNKSNLRTPPETEDARRCEI